MKTRGMALLVVPWLASCSLWNYGYRGHSFHSPEEVLAAQREIAAREVARIVPREQALPGTLRVLLPAEATFRTELMPHNEAFARAPAVLVSTYGALMCAEIDTYVAALERRKLLTNVIVVRQPAPALPDDADYELSFALVGGRSRWLLTSRRWDGAWLVSADASKDEAEHVTDWLALLEGLLVAGTDPPPLTQVTAASALESSVALQGATPSPSTKPAARGGTVAVAVLMGGGAAYGSATSAENAALLDTFGPGGGGKGQTASSSTVDTGLSVEWALWRAAPFALNLRGQWSHSTITKRLDQNVDGNLRESYSAEVLHNDAWLAGPEVQWGGEYGGLEVEVPAFVLAGPLSAGLLRSYPLLRYYDPSVDAAETAFSGWRFDIGAGLHFVMTRYLLVGVELRYTRAALTQREALYDGASRRSVVQGGLASALVGFAL